MKFKATYDGNHDTFRVEFLVVPVGGLAFLVNHDFSPLEVCYVLIIVYIVLNWTCMSLAFKKKKQKKKRCVFMKSDPVDLLHLSWVSGHPASALPDQ